MPITPINGDLTAGIAGSYSETINPSPDPLITGDVPAVFTTDELVAPSQTLAANAVVGFDATGALVMAKTSAPAVKPIGVLVAAVTTGPGDTSVRASVRRGGCFNPDLLVWHVDYDTDEKKRLAFEGSPAPTQVVIRAPATMTV